ncbi:MAG: GDP-mannose 4,6-dehydratase [Alphaproteobacteria bacterium RIFCSPHIGHO2_12_FULL_45_9]|nr:MAG: GDP-mannose 4,6-dehydratase [Alphaproteobacteria bacterium RIFCSPHIGHO2_02_FULL_46_13]OFW95888.1 MAG: GDP-mannose 4,6-dehydratase [Alphaproteobacteria bacterium RIFCSPHIGHO2_12_FULL_45_9]
MPEDKQPKTALITGITGQDGAYLSNLLLHKGYKVHGLRRRASLPNTDRLHSQIDKGLILHYGDMTDAGNIIRLVNDIQPDEIYNLAAQSHVHVSFDSPEYTANADGLGALRILEAIRILGIEQKTRFFQASTSELFGKVKASPQNEDTPFYPRSPYAVAKLYAYWTAVNYREAYGIYAVNGILFNHESPLRGEEFVTRKITLAAAQISKGLVDCLYLGNLDAKRDWSHAQDMMDGVWAMLQQPTAGDYVLASGVAYSVREFTTLAFAELGVDIEWSGSGVDEVGRNKSNGQIIVRIDPQYFRPTEVDFLLGDSTRARQILKWEPKISFSDLVREMVQMDLRRLEL